jgi:hypothetical protein
MRSKAIRRGLLAAALAIAGTSAPACIPWPPGYEPPPPPTPEQRARLIVDGSTDIVSGIVTRGTDHAGGAARFRIAHVYKGTQKAGATLRVTPGWGFDLPPCPGMMTPPRAFKGSRGVIFFRGDPATLNFIADDDLALMFTMGLLQRPRR